MTTCSADSNSRHIPDTKDTSQSVSVKVEEPAPNLRYEVRFDNIVSDEEEYTITISTGSEFESPPKLLFRKVSVAQMLILLY